MEQESKLNSIETGGVMLDEEKVIELIEIITGSFPAKIKKMAIDVFVDISKERRGAKTEMNGKQVDDMFDAKRAKKMKTLDLFAIVRGKNPPKNIYVALDEIVTRN